MFYYFFVSITVLSREILDLSDNVLQPELEKILTTPSGELKKRAVVTKRRWGVAYALTVN